MSNEIDIDDFDMYDEDDEDYRKAHKELIKRRMQNASKFVKRQPKPSKKDKIQRGGVRDVIFDE